MKRNRPSYDAHLVAWGQNTHVDNLLEKCLFWFSAKGMICSVTGQKFIALLKDTTSVHVVSITVP